MEDEERSAEEIAIIFSSARDSVIPIYADKTDDETEDEYKDMIQRNVDHLELIKAYKKIDGVTSIWTDEDFTEIDKAIIEGKSKLGA